MAANRVICQVDDLDTAVKVLERQNCSIKWQALTGCAVMDCEDNKSPSVHEGMDQSYADYWGEIPD